MSHILVLAYPWKSLDGEAHGRRTYVRFGHVRWSFRGAEGGGMISQVNRAAAAKNRKGPKHDFARCSLRLPTPGWLLHRLRQHNIELDSAEEGVFLVGLLRLQPRMHYDGALSELSDEEELQWGVMRWPCDFYSGRIEALWVFREPILIRSMLPIGA